MSAAERAGVVTPSQTDVPTGAPEAAVRKKGPGRKKHTFTKTEEQLIRYIAAETALRGSACCSKRELADIIGVSVKTMDRSISDLRRRGYIEVEMNYSENGAQTHSSYRVVFDREREGGRLPE